MFVWTAVLDANLYISSESRHVKVHVQVYLQQSFLKNNKPMSKQLISATAVATVQHTVALVTFSLFICWGGLRPLSWLLIVVYTKLYVTRGTGLLRLWLKTSPSSGNRKKKLESRRDSGGRRRAKAWPWVTLTVTWQASPRRPNITQEYTQGNPSLRAPRTHWPSHFLKLLAYNCGTLTHVYKTMPPPGEKKCGKLLTSNLPALFLLVPSSCPSCPPSRRKNLTKFHETGQRVDVCVRPAPYTSD